MKWKLLLTSLCLSLLLLALGWFSPELNRPAYADFWEDLDNTTLTGYVLDGTAKSIIENVTVYEPENEELFGIPMKYARYRVVSFDGVDMVDDVLLVGQVGDSDTFYLSYRKLDEPFDLSAGGVLYNVTQHWVESLPPALVGLYLTEGGDFMFTFFGEYEIADGYYLGGDVLLGMEDMATMNRDFVDFKFWGKHNFKPDGSTYGEIGVYNISGATFYYGGVGFSF